MSHLQPPFCARACVHLSMHPLAARLKTGEGGDLQVQRCLTRQHTRYGNTCADTLFLPLMTLCLQANEPVTEDLHETIEAMLAQMNRAIDTLPDLSAGANAAARLRRALQR